MSGCNVTVTEKTNMEYTATDTQGYQRQDVVSQERNLRNTLVGFFQQTGPEHNPLG